MSLASLSVGTSGRGQATRGLPAEVACNNRDRVEYAKKSLEEMARVAAAHCQNGTISVEIPVKDGRLGKVKRMQIVFQRE
jgi:hypothetical protein